MTPFEMLHGLCLSAPHGAGLEIPTVHHREPLQVRWRSHMSGREICNVAMYKKRGFCRFLTTHCALHATHVLVHVHGLVARWPEVREYRFQFCIARNARRCHERFFKDHGIASFETCGFLRDTFRILEPPCFNERPHGRVIDIQVGS